MVWHIETQFADCTSYSVLFLWLCALVMGSKWIKMLPGMSLVGVASVSSGVYF
jgi:hypothetical protein